MLLHKHLAMGTKEIAQTPGSAGGTPLQRFALLQEREEQVSFWNPIASVRKSVRKIDSPPIR